ncbi:MAG TPA: glycosyltransferase [Phenylobacterium sp.]
MDAVQRAVLTRTPVAARRIRYLGSAGPAFADALQARNPHTEILLESDAASPVEVLVADDLAHLLAQGDARALLDQAEALATAIPAGTVDAGALLKALVDRGFEVLHLQPVDDAESYFDDCVQDLVLAWQAGDLAAAPTPRPLAVVARRGAGRPRMLLSMLTFSPTLMDIRTRLPAIAMRSEPDLLVQHQRPPTTLPTAPVNFPKIVVLQRPAPPPDVDAWRAGIRDRIEKGWITVMEFDDHPLLTARTNGREVVEADWIRFSCAHAVQTSTPLLETLFRELNPETRMFANAAFSLEKFPENLPKRVFYGAVQRGPHAVEVARALAPAISALPGVEYVVVGDQAVFDALPTARKRFHPLLPYEEYLRLMGTCSISLSPVEDHEQNAAKSDAKFLDAAARGVLTIASPTIYAGVIRHGKNGMIASRVEEWAPMLTQALRDDGARRRMARNAWEYVQGARMFADQIRSRHDWYRDLWRRRDELNAALLARL